MGLEYLNSTDSQIGITKGESISNAPHDTFSVTPLIKWNLK